MVSIFLRGIGDSWDRRLLRPRLALSCASIHELLHQRSQVFGSLHSAKDDDPALDGFPVLILRAVEEGIPLYLRHLQDGPGLALALPFLRPCVD
jgi:hypothetical protein